MADENVDKMLKMMGRSSRTRAASTGPGPDCLSSEQLEAMAASRLSEEDRTAAEHHLAGCERCAHYLALLVRSERPYAEERLDVIERLALEQLGRGSREPAAEPRTADDPHPPRAHLEVAAGATLPSSRDGAHDRAAATHSPGSRPTRVRPDHRRRWWSIGGVGAALSAALLLLVVNLREPHRSPKETAFPAYTVKVAGALMEVRDDSATRVPTGVPAFTSGSQVEVGVAPTAGALRGDEALIVLVARPDSTLTRADSGAISPTPHGFGLSAGARELFGTDAGQAELWFIVGRSDALPSSSELTGSIEEVRSRLDSGEQKGRWWWESHPIQYRVE